MLPLVARDAVVAGMGPRAILAAGGGAALGILLGGGVIGALTLLVLAWLIAIAVPVGRRHLRQRPTRVDPFSLREPWRDYVQEAYKAQARFREATQGLAGGPLRERLDTIGARLALGIDEVARVARRGQQLEDVRRQIDSGGVLAELGQVETDAGQGWAAGSNIERTAEALRSQLATAERLDRVLKETHDRLRLLDARLDEAVARSLELSVGDEPADLGGLNTTVEGVLEEMEALRLALDEADGGAPPRS